MSVYDKSQPVIHDQLTQTENKTTLVGQSNVVITFSQEINALEIVNNSSTATIYLDFSGIALISTSIPIYPKQYYSCSRKMLSFNIISDTISTDVRIMGHYEFVKLN
jgi:hypothetical protein